VADAVVAYIPVLHEGYHRFLAAHARGRPLYLIGPELYADYRPLAKDIRALSADAAAQALRGWGICSQVEVLDECRAHDLASDLPSLVLPAEDVSYQVVERYFPRCSVYYDPVFLRWDKTKTVQLLRPAAREVTLSEAAADLLPEAMRQAARSIDWWRRVGAAIRFADGRVASASNEHSPHPLSAYVVGDPRTNFYKGVHLELSTVMHAEACLIAEAARHGVPTAGAVLYVTDFPCPPCAKLIAAAGVERLYFDVGYAVLDGEDVLAAAGVETLRLSAAR
jgi:dCMP deaminase